MNPLRLTVRRTVGQTRSAYLTSFVVGAFLSATAALFAFDLGTAEGGTLSGASVWAAAVSPLLPVLAAVLGMGSWSDEYRSGRIDTMLVSPVSVTDFVLGKFVGVWLVTMLSVMLSLLSSIALLNSFAPSCQVTPLSFIVAFLVLAMQGLLWCAVSVAASAACTHSAIAACVSLSALVALPRGIWAAMRAWSKSGAPSWGDFPADAHVIDFSSGSFSGGTVVSYAILTMLALFFAIVLVESRRQQGRNVRSRHLASALVLSLASVLAALLVVLAVRLDFTFDLPVSGAVRYSERTEGILAEAYGDISVTCFVPRSDRRYRPVARSLRRLAREASLHGGVRLHLRFVDPVWDFGEASRLVRAGVASGSVVFANDRRSVVLPLEEGLGERPCASAILRLTAPPQRQIVRWTRGHGEAAFDDYGAFGLSDIARELTREGYGNLALDLASDATIPIDCALVVIAGAREEFSRAECARLEAYLRQGGRLLVLVNSGESGGVSTLLSGWGIGIVGTESSATTVTGSDVVVRSFADHPVTAPLQGASLVLERPVAFKPSAAIGAADRADRIGFTSLAVSGGDCVAAIVERGHGVGTDLGIRPTRIIAVGDASFVMNGMLASRANANCDFFLNAVACLAGTDAMTSGGVSDELLALGMDRVARGRFFAVGVFAVPTLISTLLFVIAYFRRHRR